MYSEVKMTGPQPGITLFVCVNILCSYVCAYRWLIREVCQPTDDIWALQTWTHKREQTYTVYINTHTHKHTLYTAVVNFRVVVYAARISPLLCFFAISTAFYNTEQHWRRVNY